MTDISTVAPTEGPVVFFESQGPVSCRLSREAIAACRRVLKSIVASRGGTWRLILGPAEAEQAWARQLAQEAGMQVHAAGSASAEWRVSADARLVLFADEQPQAPASLGAGAAR